MTRNRDHPTEITDHEGIARSREEMRSPKILPPGPDQLAKPLESTTGASANPLASAATDETNAQTDL